MTHSPHTNPPKPGVPHWVPKQLQARPETTGTAAEPNPERDRLLADLNREANWKRWGPYLSERQWGTVREDYSADGSCWTFFPHDHARSRAYRWGEDGLLGITDRECRLCFAVALWNGKDPILKERLFGLTGPEGNHGEDVKEEYFYLDSTPTHSYMRAMYKYPQAAYPYDRIVAENAPANRGRDKTEFELADTGVFDDGRTWEVQAEYAKADTDDILIRLTISNRGPDAAMIHVLPTFWFRNTWTWGCTHEGCWVKPRMQASAKPIAGGGSKGVIELESDHVSLGKTRCWSEAASDGTVPELLFTDNHTNMERIFGTPNPEKFVKDAFNDRVVHDNVDAVNPAQTGTKAAGWYKLTIPAGKSVTIRARITAEAQIPKDFQAFSPAFDEVFTKRIAECQRFYSDGRLGELQPEEKTVAEQAYAGLLWSKQFYHYIVGAWLDGDPNQPTPPASRLADTARNTDWRNVYARDVISMPDKWEYPWFAAWDLAFHCVALAQVDPQFAKDQLLLVMREWYMHPSGAIPAYEFAFGDVNPPVHAWACWRVYKITGKRGERDRVFLARAFHKLLLNFTWWVNRKDPDGKNVFGGGFLGLDNIGVFDRSKPLPEGVQLEQADGTAWMAFFCGTMLSMALELASEDPAYEDVASKFFEHFIAIVDAMNNLSGSGLWNDQDGFYYDHLRVDAAGDGKTETIPLKVRSLVGIVPLLAVEVIQERHLENLPGFLKRTRWFMAHRADLAKHVSIMTSDEGNENALLAIPSRERLTRVLKYALDENEFLSPYGLRSLSKYHCEHPFVLNSDGQDLQVSYVPGESSTAMFGGNSNWRGPVWFPLNYLFIEALERYHHFYGENFTIEYPTGSGKKLTLAAIADDLRRRLTSLFIPGADGIRPSLNGTRNPADSDEERQRSENVAKARAADPHWKNLVLFHEYFNGDTGRGLGASHQTGWTGLVGPLLKDMAKARTQNPIRS